MEKWKCLSGSTLKLLAVVCMLIDHLAAFFWVDNPAFREVLFTFHARPVTPYFLCRAVGRIAFPLFAFLIVEGFQHTHSRKQYAFNLLLFALLSEIPWNLVHGGWLCPRQNVLFTLLLGCLGLCALERWKDNAKYLALSIIGLFVVSIFLRADYGYVGFSFILMLYVLRSCAPVQAVVGCALLPSHLIAGLSFIPINLYNGRRGFIHGPVGKYLFYSFYPLHLLVIALLKNLPC